MIARNFRFTSNTFKLSILIEASWFDPDTELAEVGLGLFAQARLIAHRRRHGLARRQLTTVELLEL
jgi:hypothetical protein